MGVAAADDATAGDRGLDSLFAKHGDMVSKLLGSLKQQNLPVGEGTGYDDIWALRFCLSNESDEDALKNATETLRWREENKEILDAAAEGTSLDRFAPLEKLVITDYHGYTTAGAPLFVVRAGISNAPAMMDAYKQVQVVEFMMYRKEIGFLLCDSITRKTRILTKLVTVNDLNHVSLVAGTDSRFSKVLGAVSKKSEIVYPQLLDRAVLINAPYVFSAMWGLVKGLLSKKTRSKISVCATSDTRTEDISKCPFAKFLNLETLPSFLGGKCRCAGGCLCGVSNEQTQPVGVRSEDGMTKAYIPPRDSLKVYMDCKAGDQVLCVVHVGENKGIEISAAVKSSGEKNNTVPTTLIQKFKHKTGTNWEQLLTIPTSGTLVIDLNNEYSLLNSKKVEYRVDAVGG